MNNKISLDEIKPNTPYEFEIKLPIEGKEKPIKVYALKTKEGFIKIGQHGSEFQDL